LKCDNKHFLLRKLVAECGFWTCV